jgi:hypothetical protein
MSGITGIDNAISLIAEHFPDRFAYFVFVVHDQYGFLGFPFFHRASELP